MSLALGSPLTGPATLLSITMKLMTRLSFNQRTEQPCLVIEMAVYAMCISADFWVWMHFSSQFGVFYLDVLRQM